MKVELDRLLFRHFVYALCLGVRQGELKARFPGPHPPPESYLEDTAWTLTEQLLAALEEDLDPHEKERFERLAACLRG